MSEQQEPATITLHVGAQPVRIPAAQLAETLRGGVRKLDEWKGHAPGAQLVAYSAAKAALNLFLPFVSTYVDAAAAYGILPPLPKRPRHSDPIAYVLGYVAEALPAVLSRGAWRISVDASGAVPPVDWLQHTDDAHPAQLPERVA